MEVPCPQCRANLVLPDAVIGQSVRCPACQTVLHAKSGWLTIDDDGDHLLDNVVLGVAAEEFKPWADDGEDDLDDLVPPAERSFGRELSRLQTIGAWLRVVAVLDVLALVAVGIAIDTATTQHEPFRPGIQTPPGLTLGVCTCCGTISLSPLCLAMLATAGRLIAMRLDGFTQVGVALGVLNGLVLAACVVFTLGALQDQLRHRVDPLPQAVAALFVAVMALATLIVSVQAIRARRTAIAARIPQRLADDEKRYPSRDFRGIN